MQLIRRRKQIGKLTFRILALGKREWSFFILFTLAYLPYCMGVAGFREGGQPHSLYCEPVIGYPSSNVNKIPRIIGRPSQRFSF